MSKQPLATRPLQRGYCVPKNSFRTRPELWPIDTWKVQQPNVCCSFYGLANMDRPIFGQHKTNLIRNCLAFLMRNGFWPLVMVFLASGHIDDHWFGFGPPFAGQVTLRCNSRKTFHSCPLRLAFAAMDAAKKECLQMLSNLGTRECRGWTVSIKVP